MASCDFEIQMSGLDEAAARIADRLTPKQLRSLNREVGINVRERTVDHIAKASVTRHKTADRLGAMHTGFLEFAVARGRLRGESDFNGKLTDGRGRPFSEVQDISDKGVAVVIGNTPGLSRAFHPLVITPKKAKALTIPVHKFAYGKSVKDLRAEGHVVFRVGKCLAEAAPEERNGIRPLYALMKKTTIPQDRGLLPKESEYADWAADTAEAFLELAE